MASVNLDSSHHHQPLPSAVRPVQRRPTAENRGPSTVSNAHSSDEENDGPLPSLGQLLRGAGEAQDPQHAVSSVEHGSGTADGAAEHCIPIDCDDPPTAGAKGGGDQCGETDGRSRVRPNSDGSASKEQDGQQGSLSTPPTSVPGSEAGYDPYNLRSLISLLTEAYNLGLPSSARRQIILSPLLLPLLLLHLHHHHHQSLMSPFLRHSIHRQNQVTAPQKISDLVPPMEEKRRQTQGTGTMEMERNEMGTGRPRAPQVFEIPPSAQRAVQV